MHFESGNCYHIFNRGINKQVIFFSDRNYRFFLYKLGKHLLPHCSILAYCLMPTHFHLLIKADDRSEILLNNFMITQNVISNGIRIILSSYSQAINKQLGRTGNLFQQKTKAKTLDSDIISAGSGVAICNYESVCFDYIHNNPVKAGLVFNPGDWKYSSYNEYYNIWECTEKLCDKQVTEKIIGINQSHRYSGGTG